MQAKCGQNASSGRYDQGLKEALRQFVGQASGKAASDAAVKAEILHCLQRGQTTARVR